MPTVIQKNMCEDFWVWKDVFDRDDITRSEHGISQSTIYQSGEEPNTCYVVMQIESISKLHSYNEKFFSTGKSIEAGIITSENTVCHDVT